MRSLRRHGALVVQLTLSLLRSPHHLEALERLGLPRLEAIKVHLAEQEAKRAEEASVKSAQTAVKHKRQRGGARARRAREKAAVGAA